ncbi:hypothetical protein [Halorubrum sp. BV1]|uniref:hypothetical protein n=1 Tax=Halorubrum sp. BV1 TaxID=1498500 RepID=UPI000679D499|nr:hypothetical protein [Halorubrum sp. BV1]
MTLDTAPPPKDESETGAEHGAVPSDDDADDDPRPADGDASHLDDLEDGAGCTEIWEKLSEGRE